MLREYDNLYADISAGSGHRALTRDPDFGLRFIHEMQDKLLYGTDNFDTQHIDLLQSLDLSEDVFAKITHENAARLVPE
jgi:hypothetical protein